MRAASKFTRRASVVAGACMCIATLARCSLFVDTDGLSGGDSGALVLDGSSSDAPASNDASLDGGNSSDGAIATDAGFPGCGASHTICDDFDDDGVILTHWSDDTLYGGSALEFVSDASVSPPQSMHSSGPATAGSAGAALYKSFSQTTSKIHCEAQALIRSGTPQTLAFEFAGAVSTDEDYITSVNLGTGGSHLDYFTDYFDGGGDFHQDVLPAVPSGQWSHVTFDMIPTADGTETVVVNVGGTILVRPFSAPAGATLTKITLGEDFAMAGFDALYDNVLCDVTP